MKGFFCISSIFGLLLVSFLVVHASDGIIQLDDSYVEGIITASDIEGQSINDVELRVYSFQVNEPGYVELHFITHINTMKFKIRDADENIIKEEYIYSDKSPYNYSLMLDQGIYTLHIIGTHNFTPGDYKFKMKMQPIITDNNISLGTIENISIDQTYTGYFSSKEEQKDTEKKYSFNIIDAGKYFLRIEPEINMSFSVRDADENEIENGYVYVDDKYENLLEFESGKYTLTNMSNDAGQYTFSISKEETKAIDTNRNERKLETLIDKILSPSTFLGAIIVGVIVGVLVAIIIKHFKLS